MVKEIKRIRTNLEVESFGDLGVLNHCQINISEVRTQDAVATHVSESGRRAGRLNREICRKHPLIQRIFGHRNLAQNQRSDRVSDAGDVSARNYYGKWISTLRAHNRRQLPSAYRAIAFERQLINRVDDEAVTGIEVGVAFAAYDVQAVRHDHSVAVARHIVNGVRVGVRGVELQAMGELFVSSDPQGVIGRGRVAVTFGEGISKANTGQNRTARRQRPEGPARGSTQSEELVDVPVDLQMCALA